MRRASNRIPKRSLEPHFEMSHSVPNPKGRAARRGPTGSSKAHKASHTCTGATLTLNTAGDPALIVHHLIAAMYAEALASTEHLVSTSGDILCHMIYMHAQ